jgi:predicted ArsR family transcriptional regulator
MGETLSRQTARNRHKALSGQSRLALLEALGQQDRPVDAEGAARLVNLHRNTARVHLEQLADAGLVERQAEDRSRPGRPRVLYRVVPDASAPADPSGTVSGGGEYRQLASILAAQLAASTDAAQQAEEAGRRWAAAIHRTAKPDPIVTPQAATAALTAAMEDLGFSPAADGERIILRSCPFAELAGAQRVVVCGTHLGLIKQMLETFDTPLAVERLDPLVQSDPPLCVVHLSTPASRPGAKRTTDKESSTP